MEALRNSDNVLCNLEKGLETRIAAFSEEMISWLRLRQAWYL